MRKSGVLDVSYMIEVVYGWPEDHAYERKALDDVESLGGVMTYKELAIGKNVTLTIEFDEYAVACKAIDQLRSRGVLTYGPSNYGP